MQLAFPFVREHPAIHHSEQLVHQPVPLSFAHSSPPMKKTARRRPSTDSERQHRSLELFSLIPGRRRPGRQALLPTTSIVAGRGCQTVSPLGNFSATAPSSWYPRLSGGLDGVFGPPRPGPAAPP